MYHYKRTASIRCFHPEQQIQSDIFIYHSHRAETSMPCHGSQSVQSTGSGIYYVEGKDAPAAKFASNRTVWMSHHTITCHVGLELFFFHFQPPV